MTILNLIMLLREFMAVLRSFFQYQYAGILFCKLTNLSAAALIAYANIVLGEVYDMTYGWLCDFILESLHLISDEHFVLELNH